MGMLTNYKPEDITPSMRKYLGMPEPKEVAKDEGTSEGAKKGWETRKHGGSGESTAGNNEVISNANSNGKEQDYPNIDMVVDELYKQAQKVGDTAVDKRYIKDVISEAIKHPISEQSSALLGGGKRDSFTSGLEHYGRYAANSQDPSVKNFIGWLRNRKNEKHKEMALENARRWKMDALGHKSLLDSTHGEGGKGIYFNAWR